jgi:DnaJ-class molecular chaperone
MVILTERDTRPTCPCCGGSGMHGLRPFVSPSDRDDSEGCTNCDERGTTFFTDARPNSCAGYRTMIRRNR